MVSLKSFDGGEFDAYLSLPGGGCGPGIVLLQEIFGVNQVMRDIADWYAERGFVVICPDLFWRQQPGVQLTDQTEAEWQQAFKFYQGLDEAKAVDDAGAALAFLRNHPACNGKVGAVGFCLGGKLAYLLAARYGPDCSVGYYGVGIENALEEIAGLKGALMLHLAEKDQYCPPEAQARIHAALDNNPRVTLHDYAGQDHAFARLGGAHFHAASAELANLRSVEFFVRYLNGGAPAAKLSALWDDHVKYEFVTRNTEDTLLTMVEDSYVNHIPVLTGGVGHAELREFYSRHFIPQMPPDTAMTAVSRTIGADRVVDEMVFEFTHTIEMDWMLPGVPPTGKHVKVPLVVIVHFRDGKLAHEHIYWDQASVLAQLGLIDAAGLPVAGVESAEKVLNPSLPANRLMRRADG
ncbi:MAG TPA: dienelactone hydrolase family protein [Blastocatellia bacterium]|nr:dienelactone hydrolase family protein [Blastocatellia bacterium]HMY75469.1 dienelactone hydrolase family protein [Blastocatellia bacterium]HMZ23085.1 dienelactone hydrolase family protein [Blastocatellia bacterium]HNG33111.1 dienelactone hydrolase family protein [Blastocatellia bacterium]